MSEKNHSYYLDYAATTPVDAEVIAAELPYFGASFQNPASSHILGQIVSTSLEYARSRCCKAIGAQRGTVYFTSGGTEAINMAVKGVAVPAGGRIAVSAIEHDAVIACAQRLKSRGVAVDTIIPNSDGVITPDALRSVMTENTALVCVMTVNNIVGTIQPIKELAEIAHGYGALFFTDAVQAVNCTDIDVADTDVDMLCVSGHKFYAPKGTGFLYVKKGITLEPLFDGGSQEGGLRAGTVDVAGAVAISEAISRAQSGVAGYNAHAKAVCDAFINTLEVGEPISVGADKAHDILSVAFDGVNGGRLAVALSVAGVCCSVGSACSAGSATPPPTLVAMGYPQANSSVRFSFGKPTTIEAAVAAAKIVDQTVKRLKGEEV